MKLRNLTLRAVAVAAIGALMACSGAGIPTSSEALASQTPSADDTAQAADSQAPRAQKGAQAPDFEATGIDGQTFRISQKLNKGKHLVIMFSRAHW